MNKLFARAFIVLLITAFGPLSLKAGGPWSPQKGKGLVIAGISVNTYFTVSGPPGFAFKLNRWTTDFTLNGYLEYGLVKGLALQANVPFKLVNTANKLRPQGEFATILGAGTLVGVGNAEIGLKYQFLQKKGWAMAFGIFGETFATPPVTAKALRVGYSSFGVMPMLYVGKSFKNRIYIQLEGGVMYRSHGYSTEWRAEFEIGYKFKKPLWIALRLQARESFQNGSRLNLVNDIQTALYMNNEGYTAWSLKFAYEINEKMGLNFSLGGGITTRFIARTPAVSVGYYFKI